MPAGENFAWQRRLVAIRQARHCEHVPTMATGRRCHQVDHRHRTFTGDAARIHADASVFTNRAGNAVRIRPPSAPVANVNFIFAQDHSKGGDAHIPSPQNISVGGIQFQQSVGKIAADIDFFAIARNGDAGGNFLFPSGDVGRRQRDGKQRRNFPVFADGEYFDVAVHIRQINPCAIRRKFQAGETQLRFFIRVQNGINHRFFLVNLVRWKGNALQNFPGRRIHGNQFVGEAGGHQQFLIGA